MWKLEYDFPSGQWKRRAPLLWDDLAVRPERTWLHSLRNWQKRIWWSHGHKEVIPLQALMGFRVVSTSVREAYVLNFSTTRTHTCLRVALSQLKLPTAELCVFPSLSTSTTMEGSWKLQMELRLQDSHHNDQSRPSLVHHEVYASLSEMYFFQANDG